MSSTDLNAAEQSLLLDVAARSIRHGLRRGTPLAVEAETFPEHLRPLRATFVSLHRHGELRGCIGTLVAERPLVEDVARHAFAAAFEDPRFPPLAERELAGLALEISILTPAEPFPVASEEELLEQLRIGTDGLILHEGWRRATFLPAVWESLSDPREFVAHLKMKAGLPPRYWSDGLRFERYTTVSFGTQHAFDQAANGDRRQAATG